MKTCLKQQAIKNSKNIEHIPKTLTKILMNLEITKKNEFKMLYKIIIVSQLH